MFSNVSRTQKARLSIAKMRTKKKLGNIIPSFTVNIKKKEYLLDKRRRRSQRFRLLLLSSVKYAEPTKKQKGSIRVIITRLS